MAAKKKAYDFKTEQKEYYRPSKKPSIVLIPKMNFLAVRGKGDPNEENGEYKKAMELLYPLAFTIRMSYKGDHLIPGFFEYVVPPLEGLWWNNDNLPLETADKENFNWISMIRLPEFVTLEEFEWAKKEAEEKKKMDFSKVEFFSYDEGECVQCMHVGSYDEESQTIEKLNTFAKERGYNPDFSKRFHHEIYLSDPRRTKTENLKTVIRIPIKQEEN